MHALLRGGRAQTTNGVKWHRKRHNFVHRKTPPFWTLSASVALDARRVKPKDRLILKVAPRFIRHLRPFVADNARVSQTAELRNYRCP